jgi:rare lipoprotein A (peptidoglycan hydrolase)
VTLVDWCACKGDRVIDLYGEAFRRLAPLGRGIVEVSVRW